MSAVKHQLGPGSLLKVNNDGSVRLNHGSVSVVGKNPAGYAWYPKLGLLAEGYRGNVADLVTINPGDAGPYGIHVGLTKGEASSMPNVNCHEPITGICLVGPDTAPQTTFVLHDGRVVQIAIGPRITS